MKLLILFICIVFSACNQAEKTIEFNIKNNSNIPVDSLKIGLNNSDVKLNHALKPNDSINLEMKHLEPEKVEGSNVFIIYYFQQGKGYYANFGYHSSSAFIKKEYDVFIFNEGVAEINKKTEHLKENKHQMIIN